MKLMTPDDGQPIRGPMSLSEQSDSIMYVVLTGNAAYITIPVATSTSAAAGKALMEPTSSTDFWMQFDVTTFSVPAANSTTAGLGPELNPLLRSCYGHTTMCFNSSSNCTICVSFFK